MAKAAASNGTKAKSPSKSEVLNSIAESTGLQRKQVQAVLDALTAEIGKSVGKKGPGVFQIPGVAKVYVHIRKARPARKNAPDPFNPGQFRDYAAKPESRVIKIKPLKQLKEIKL